MIKGFLSRKVARLRQPTIEETKQPTIEENIRDRDLVVSTDSALEKLQGGAYDFVDLGTCDGGGFTIAERLGGTNGLGFDLEPSAVRRARGKGLDVALYDICDLDIDHACVDFGVCSHILEHLPSLDHVETVLRSLVRLCRRFILIAGPLFEHEDYLGSFGIKALHSLMLDHTCKLRLAELQNILHKIDCRDYTLAVTEPIRDSSNIWLHNAAEPVPPDGLWTYDEGKHLPKPSVDFDRAIYRDFVCVVSLNEDVRRDDVLRRFYWGFDRVIVDSSWKF